MSQETSKSLEEAENPQVMSPEQMVEMREKMNAYYDEELPMLEKQEKFERLQADIEEHKVRRMTMMIRSAQMYAQAEMAEQGSDHDIDDSKSSEKKSTQNRTLKKS